MTAEAVERPPTRIERARYARARLDAGDTYKQVAADMDLTVSGLKNLVYDPDGSKQKARRERYQGTCVDCGAKTDGSNGRANAPKRCAKCAADAQHDERYWTRETIIEAIKRFGREHGRAPVATDWLYGKHGVNGSGYPWPGFLIREFGSWANGIEAAGFPRPFVGHNHNGRKIGRGPIIPTEALLERLRDVSTDGVAPSTDWKVCRAAANVRSALRQRGITWTEACELAGVRPKRPAMCRPLAGGSGTA